MKNKLSSWQALAAVGVMILSISVFRGGSDPSIKTETNIQTGCQAAKQGENKITCRAMVTKSVPAQGFGHNVTLVTKAGETIQVLGVRGGLMPSPEYQTWELTIQGEYYTDITLSKTQPVEVKLVCAEGDLQNSMRWLSTTSGYKVNASLRPEVTHPGYKVKVMAVVDAEGYISEIRQPTPVQEIECGGNPQYFN